LPSFSARLQPGAHEGQRLTAPHRASLSFLQGGGEVGALMRAHDWSSSALGEPAFWPQPLKTLASLMLNSPGPIFMCWGTELSFLYNTAYLDILGDKHPGALGRPFYEVWSEVRPSIEALVRRTLSGEPVHCQNAPFTLRRSGQEALAWFDFSYAPVHSLDGQVAGLYCTLLETTGQVLAEQHRQLETVRLRALFEQAPSFMVVTQGPSHVFALANSAYFRLVGQRDLMGQPIRQALADIEGQGYSELLDQVYATGQPFIGHKMPVTFEAQAGALPEPRFVNFVLQPMTGADGRVNGIFIEGVDVTEHVRSEEALRLQKHSAVQAVQRLDALLEAAPVGISLIDADGQLLRVNLASRGIWGADLLASAEAYRHRKGWWADGSAKHGEPVEAHEWASVRALQGQSPRDIVEIQALDAAGTRRTIVNCAAPVRDAQGRITGAVITQMDITDRVQAEAALRESEAQFRTITNAMPQMVWSCLSDGEHDYFNQQFYDYADMPTGAGHGDAWVQLLHPEDRQRTHERWSHSLHTGQPYENECRLRHHSGQYRWNLARALPVRSAQGAIVRWMGTSTDIHAHKLTQQALVEADRQKDEFLAMLAHELRNPLMPITSAAELLATGTLDERGVAKMSGLIFRHAVHMTGLINDLLDVSRITQGLVELEAVPVELKAVVEQALEQVQPLLSSKAHHLQVRLPIESAWVRGNALRLVQVLVNVLSNASKYTPGGGRIELEMTLTSSQVRLAVRDNGMGMSAALLGRAFELFAQGEREADRSQGGLGIGLALVKQLVALHGGEVTARSAGPGQGSEFTLVLPRLLHE
jgi:PAS domain S-box-containing protein